MHTRDPWVAVNGVSHKGPHMKTWVSFLDCIELHKLTIFSCDAAELQRYYMQQGVKKPQGVPVRSSFMAQTGLLNDYLAHLPTVKDNPMSVEDTKKGNEPFGEAHLAGITLKAVLSLWVNQYNLTHSALPKSPRQLLPDLENIERAKARAKDSAALAGVKSSPKKRASTGSSKRVPKKACTASSASIARIMAGPTRPTTAKNVTNDLV